MKNKLKKTTAALLAAALVFGGVPASEGKGIFGGLGTCVDAYAATISGDTISLLKESGTVSSDMTCTRFRVIASSMLTVNQGVTLTLNNPGRNFTLMDKSKIELHGTLTGSAGSDAMWLSDSYINVYLSDGAKYTVTGLSCDDGDNYLRYYGYDAATDGNGTVSVKNGSTDVTSDSVGYKTTSYTYTAAPAEGYKFKNWTKGKGGEVLGTETSINVTCEQNGQYQVYANFEVNAQEETVDAVIAKINEIGEVEYTNESQAKIAAARLAYTALDEDQQKLVINSAALTNAEKLYLALKASKSYVFGDVDGDGELTILDATHILKKVSNPEYVLPIIEKLQQMTN